uniref:Uncharacterized protein n=1 Tax=Anguilla anguilla TaxID=7936 RepID=A0A0E9SI46_ANGAN
MRDCASHMLSWTCGTFSWRTRSTNAVLWTELKMELADIS